MLTPLLSLKCTATTFARTMIAQAMFIALLTGCAPISCQHCSVGEIPLTRIRDMQEKPFPPLKYAHAPADSPFRHIYLEGDGNPWHKGRVPSNNPNSHQKLALRLMLLDSSDRLYLERPCYGFAKPPLSCSNIWWTHARYSNAVVTALDEAISALQTELGAKPLVIIGHSGGGTLAMLLAERRNDIAGVVTLAGNLAPHQWAAHHGYLPLTESLAPNFNAVPGNVQQWHFFGSRDTNIPPRLSQAAALPTANIHVEELPADHNCCWEGLWPEILTSVTHALADDMAHKKLR